MTLTPTQACAVNMGQWAVYRGLSRPHDFVRLRFAAHYNWTAKHRDRYYWVVMADNPDKTAGGSFRCLRCGDQFDPTFPLSITMYLAMMKAYQKDHRHCTERI